MRNVYAWLTAVDACFEYRIRIPFTHLPSDKWSYSWGGYDDGTIYNADVVVGQRIAGYSAEWLAVCKNPNILAVYDMDDDLINIDPQNTIPYSIYAPIAEETKRNVEAADVVTVCTPHVAEVMSKYNKNVHLLPICTTNELIDLPLRTNPLRLTVGWAGSPFHHQDWGGLPEILFQYAQRVPYAQFHFMGADYTNGMLGSIRVTGLQALEHYYASIDFDIGLAPLLKSFHNAGKSHTKPLEYAARGVPVVATAWGQYVDWVKSGENGFLVDSPDEWIDGLITLSNTDVRAQMSTNARDSARQFTIDKHIGLWEKAYGV